MQDGDHNTSKNRYSELSKDGEGQNPLTPLGVERKD